MADTVIRIKNGKVGEIEKNEKPVDVMGIEWYLLSAGILQKFQDLFARIVIERPGRLITQKKLGVFGERTRDGNTLLFPAGKLGWKILHAV